MLMKRFFVEEEAVVSAEYVVFVAAIGILLTAGVMVLFSGMGDYFQGWANFFSSGS